MEPDPARRSFSQDFLWQMRHRKLKPPARATSADLFIGVPFALLFASIWGLLLANALVRGNVLDPHGELVLRAQNPDGFAFWCLFYALLGLAGFAAAAGLVIRYRRQRRNR